MGTGYAYLCNGCGYSVSTSGPWEFYRDSQGNRKPYGHPVPTSQEARERGICGFSADMYCPKCDKIFDIILSEFKGPPNDYFSAWAAWREPGGELKDAGRVKCPECHDTNLIWNTKETEKVVCPRCKEGTMLGIAIWIA